MNRVLPLSPALKNRHQAHYERFLSLLQNTYNNSFLQHGNYMMTGASVCTCPLKRKRIDESQNLITFVRQCVFVWRHTSFRTGQIQICQKRQRHASIVSSREDSKSLRSPWNQDPRWEINECPHHSQTPLTPNALLWLNDAPYCS